MTSSRDDTQTSGPNIIANEPAKAFIPTTLQMTLSGARVAENSEAGRKPELVTMAQFMRNVHSKKDLIFALGVQGK